MEQAPCAGSAERGARPKPIDAIGPAPHARRGDWGDEALRNRWAILAILFVVRLTIAFQFQSVAAVAPLLEKTFGVGLADIGILIGLYFTPGLVLALPGGAIGRTLGDKPTTIAALLLMTVGSLVMATTDIWDWQMAGRLVSGAGGVLLTVQLTKMGTDSFTGKEIATAMAIFVNSWPAGVAISLLVLPAIGSAYGASAVFLAAGALTAIGTVLITLYQPPPGVTASATSSARLDSLALLAVIVAGAIWGLYNVGFAMIFSFGPSLLAERGWSIAAAGSAISVVMWLSVISVPAGGYLADRFKRPFLLDCSQPRGGRPAGLADPVRCRDHDPCADRPGRRPSGRADHEPCRPRARAGNTGDRDGRVLHSLLCCDDAGAGGGRPARQIGRDRRRRARPRRADSAGLPAPDVAFRTHCFCSSPPHPILTRH